MLNWLDYYHHYCKATGLSDYDLTSDQQKLLYLIGVYTDATDQLENREHWFKDGPLIAAMYELTVEGVFETYDYAAMSVLCLDGLHRFMNVTREGLDDLNDLRELGLLDHLKISTVQYGTVTAYRLTKQGLKFTSRFPRSCGRRSTG